MKQIIRYLCESCGRECSSIMAAISCEKNEKQNEKIRAREAKAHERELRRQNLSEWFEDGTRRTAPKVDPKKFGPHKYEDDGTSDCAYKCGCWMGPYRSSGPTDPFGACPLNPRITSAKARRALKFGMNRNGKRRMESSRK